MLYAFNLDVRCHWKSVSNDKIRRSYIPDSGEFFMWRPCRFGNSRFYHRQGAPRYLLPKVPCTSFAFLPNWRSTRRLLDLLHASVLALIKQWLASTTHKVTAHIATLRGGKTWWTSTKVTTFLQLIALFYTKGLLFCSPVLLQGQHHTPPPQLGLLARR
jgi:hypothetical protein